MQTFALASDNFYFEFVINSEEDIAYVTKRTFQNADVDFNDQCTSMTIERARKYYASLIK